MKEFLLTQLELLAPYLPTNTLDQLINGLGGPQEVAEMTGRRGRVLRQVDGSVQYHLRSEDDVGLELLNITEKQRFMDGHKVSGVKGHVGVCRVKGHKYMYTVREVNGHLTTIKYVNGSYTCT